jgi:hypothetical protein
LHIEFQIKNRLALRQLNFAPRPGAICSICRGLRAMCVCAFAMLFIFCIICYWESLDWGLSAMGIEGRPARLPALFISMCNAPPLSALSQWPLLLLAILFISPRAPNNLGLLRKFCPRTLLYSRRALGVLRFSRLIYSGAFALGLMRRKIAARARAMCAHRF